MCSLEACLSPYALPHGAEWLPGVEGPKPPGDFQNSRMLRFARGFYIAECTAARHRGHRVPCGRTWAPLPRRGSCPANCRNCARRQAPDGKRQIRRHISAEIAQNHAVEGPFIAARLEVNLEGGDRGTVESIEDKIGNRLFETETNCSGSLNANNRDPRDACRVCE
jgi:hypothetical protein